MARKTNIERRMNTEIKNVIPEKIHLFSINIFKANLETSEAFLENPQKSDSFAFEFGHNIAQNYEMGRSRYRLFFILDAVDNQQQPVGLKVEYGIEFHFEIENYQRVVKKLDNNDLQIDVDLAATLLAMAYSTARGIIFERTRGTFFDGVILPTIDPYLALKEGNKD